MTRTLLLVVLLLWSVSAKADAEDLVESIQSVAAVKRDIKSAILHDCLVNSCADAHADDVCNFAAALDVKVGYRISNTRSSRGNPKSELPIAAKDLALMQLIYSQCRPTNNLYWNRDRMLHVVYDPTPKVDARIRNALGAKGK